MTQQLGKPKGTFAPYLTNFGATKEEQIEKNKPLMDWLQQQIKDSQDLTDEEIEANKKYLENLKATIDSFRPEGHKLYSE